MPSPAARGTHGTAPDLLLRTAGLRITPQRQLILDVLSTAAAAGTSHHLTADEVLQQVNVRYANVNRSTVYRVLDSLVNAELVVQHVLGAVAHYELASDVHHHLVCQGCGAVFDLPAADLRRLATAALSAHGFVVGVLGVTIEGQCADCAAAASPAATTGSAGHGHRPG